MHYDTLKLWQHQQMHNYTIYVLILLLSPTWCGNVTIFMELAEVWYKFPEDGDNAETCTRWEIMNTEIIELFICWHYQSLNIKNFCLIKSFQGMHLYHKMWSWYKIQMWENNTWSFITIYCRTINLQVTHQQMPAGILILSLSLDQLLVPLLRYLHQSLHTQLTVN